MTQRLGEILLAHQSINPHQLDVALALHRARGRRLGTVLEELRLCGNDRLLAALAAQAGLPPIDLDKETPDRKLTAKLSRAAAEHFQAVPLRYDERLGVLAIAVGAPADQDRLEELRIATGARAIQAFIATDQAIARGIGRLYGSRSQPAQQVILLYGWPEEDATTLLAGLVQQRLSGRIVSSAEVLMAGPKDILIAPIPAMEALLNGNRCRALLIAASKRADDFPKAEKMDACSFLLAPLDMDCVVRAVQRCNQLIGRAPKLAGAAA